MTKAMSDIRFYYHKQIKKLKEEAKMKERDYLKYIAEESATKSERTPQVDDDPFADSRKERSTIKAGMIAQSYGDYYKDIASDLNVLLHLAMSHTERQERLIKAHPKAYDGNKLKALQKSINNIQEYKEKLNNQYIK